jgi:hypothetical protein
LPATLEEFFVFMRTDDRFYVGNDDAGRARYLKLAEGYLAGMKAKLPDYFGRLPKSDLIVKRVEAFREEPGGAAHYSSGAPDGSRPGVFYVHLSDVRATPTYEIEGTCYHEGWPGHHLQISLAQEMTGIPVFRTQYGYGAYIEGWGLYVELLAKEAGFYQDLYSDFGRLGREIWRAIRLVVDTGIHAKGWSEARPWPSTPPTRRSRWARSVRRSAATSSRPARRPRTRSAWSRSWRCARRPVRRWVTSSTCAASTTPCWAPAPCRCRSWRPAWRWVAARKTA